ncbi:MAG TPA: hypothetical protein VJV79_33715 [Polyangiaceae bacterium]|nr:hypothetical protein [Polyangiaceae bacterium]
MSTKSFRDTLRRKLEARFPDLSIPNADQPDLVAEFAAKNSLVGHATVWDNDTDAMIVVGEITHFHVDSSDGDPTTLNSEERIADAVIDWLGALFADEVLLWRSPTSRGAGGHLRFEADAEFSLMGPEDETFRWSGPVPNPLATAASR